MKSHVEDCRPRHHRYCILYTSSTVVCTPVRKDGPTLVRHVRHVRLCSTLFGFVRLVRNTRTRSIKSNRTVEQLSGPTCSTKVGPHTSPSLFINPDDITKRTGLGYRVQSADAEYRLQIPCDSFVLSESSFRNETYFQFRILLEYEDNFQETVWDFRSFFCLSRPMTHDQCHQRIFNLRSNWLTALLRSELEGFECLVLWRASVGVHPV